MPLTEKGRSGQSKAEIILLRPDADYAAVGIVLPILPFSCSSSVKNEARWQGASTFLLRAGPQMSQGQIPVDFPLHAFLFKPQNVVLCKCL